jgi:HlyD family secretion protein
MTAAGGYPPDEVRQTLGLGRRGTWHTRPGVWLAALVVAVGLGAGAWLLLRGEPAAVRYETSEARQGDLTVTVTATGDLQPLNQVEVGTEISGTIEAVEVDYNDRVRVGQVLARLDTDQLEARRRQSEAALALARARVKEAQATGIETRNRLQRTRDLIRKGMSSQEESDVAEAASARAEAVLAVAEAQVVQAQAQLDAELRTLEKAVIRSPIDGLVLERKVEPGQTVAASLQTPVLFKLAENLAQMELHVAVDEADVGQVREGQAATFTVDAYPDRHFAAAITQVRYAPQSAEGVITYETVLGVDNADLALRPGMTATAEIVVNRREGVLLVSNGALRFTPPRPETPTASQSGSLFSRLFPRPFRPPSQGAEHEPTRGESARRVWTLADGEPVPVPIRVGPTDGEWTEVTEGDVEPGMALVTDVVRARR